MKRLAGLLAIAAFTIACGTSDKGITTTVKTKMAADTIVRAYDVNVKTKNGVVTLSGDVDTSVARDEAVNIARNTKGVHDVIDRVHVRDTAATTGYLDRTAPVDKR